MAAVGGEVMSDLLRCPVCGEVVDVAVCDRESGYAWETQCLECGAVLLGQVDQVLTWRSPSARQAARVRQLFHVQACADNVQPAP